VNGGQRDAARLEDQLLASELGQRFSSTERIGLFRGPVARKPRVNRCAVTVELKAAAEHVRAIAARVLAARGRPIADRAEGHEEEVWAIVGSGFGGLKPAVVRISAIARAHGCTVVVRAATKRGLIAQRDSVKTATRVRDALVGAVAALDRG
jgi:hypothetical protein